MEKKFNTKNFIILIGCVVCIILIFLVWPKSDRFNGFIEVDGKTTNFKDADIRITDKKIIIKTDKDNIEVKKTENIILYLFKY